LVGTFVLVAKLFVAAREVAIAWRYGITPAVDAYQIALTITTWLPMMLTAVATVVLVPRFVRLSANREGYRAFISELNGTILLFAAGVALLTWLAVPLAVNLIAWGVEPSTNELVRSMARSMAPVALLTVVAGYLAARLQARESFAYSLVEAVPALTITGFVLLAPTQSFVAPLVCGTVVGFFLQFLWLGQMTAKSDPPLGGMRLRHRSQEWASLYGAVGVVAMGQIIITATIPFDQAFVTLAGEGAVAVLGYANRVIGLLTAMGSVVLARALLPVLSRTAGEGDFALGRTQSVKWSFLMFALGISITAIGWFLAPLAIRFLFERGAFTLQDSLAVAEVLRYGLLQLGPFFGVAVLVQWCAATNQYWQLIIVSLIALAVKIVFNAILVTRFGVAGVMLSTVIMYTTNFMLMLLLTYHAPVSNRRRKPVNGARPADTRRDP
jgi:peptidoglycan biosynthesis protein MviN/MurJ (putative lipid II flippase)